MVWKSIYSKIRFVLAFSINFRFKVGYKIGADGACKIRLPSNIYDLFYHVVKLLRTKYLL